MQKMWMIRGDGGNLYEDFRERGVAAIGWTKLAPLVQSGMTREQVTQLNREIAPELKPGALVSGASQVWRFVNEIEIDDWVITYSPANRTYMIGNVLGPYQYHQEWAELGMSLARPVQWKAEEVDRDSLSASSKNSLGSTLTLFCVPEFAAQELLAQVIGGSASVPDPEDIPEEVIADPLAGIESLAIERIKDLVSRLGWADMQELVAGVLRAMGYKTQVSSVGPDRGKDIIASPDGFGFENPRIVVEVKHRKGQIDSAAIRSFLGGRHKDDRGLYVSTGGFSKDAHYEADRASVPLVLWTLDELVRTLVEHYDKTDSETKRLLPLKRLYIPA